MSELDKQVHGNGSIGGIVLTAIARYPDRLALSDDHINWTYRDFGKAIAAMMATFRARGLGRGDGLAILAANRPEQLACQYAALLLGMRYTALHPMSTMDNHLYVLNDAEISALVIDSRVSQHAATNYSAHCPSLRVVFSLGEIPGCAEVTGLMAGGDMSLLRDEADPEEIAYLFYTGGTTGKPKGVMLPHRSVIGPALLQAIDWDFPREAPKFLAMTPISHASGIIVPSVFLFGGSVRLSPSFDAERFCRIVDIEQVSMSFLVPTMIYALLDYADLQRYSLASLETIVYGAAPISPDRLRSALETFGPKFVQLYGQTEVPMCITTLRKIDHLLEQPDRLLSCGLPCPGVQIKLFDSEMREVGINEPGEICVRSPLTMNGYWKRPDATAEAFHGGWMHTGDVAKKGEDGFYTIVDRTKDLIITGGFNVYPREVEDGLLSNELVKSACVIGVPDPKWGEAVIAFVVSDKLGEGNEDELKAHVRAKLGAVWTPKEILFVEEIPLTPLGKLDRKYLREVYQQRK